MSEQERREREKQIKNESGGKKSNKVGCKCVIN